MVELQIVFKTGMKMPLQLEEEMLIKLNNEIYNNKNLDRFVNFSDYLPKEVGLISLNILLSSIVMMSCSKITPIKTPPKKELIV